MNRAGIFFCTLALTAGISCGNAPGGYDECGTCHTAAEADESEFRGLDGVTDLSDPAVGAHKHHVIDDEYTNPLACANCHLVPTVIGAEDHFLGGRAEVRFGELAALGGVKPRWDPQTRTCSQVYCHGALPLSEDEDDEPEVTAAWDATSKENSLDCDSCHPASPRRTRSGAPHPPSPACQTCHANASSDSELIGVSSHIDGKVDVQEDE